MKWDLRCVFNVFIDFYKNRHCRKSFPIKLLQFCVLPLIKVYLRIPFKKRFGKIVIEFEKMAEILKKNLTGIIIEQRQTEINF